MKILIDGDNCNMISNIEKIAKNNNIECHIYVNFCCNIDSTYSEIHIVDCSKDAADFAIINNCNADDIIITNDSGLAAMVLAKNGIPINTKGLEYTKSNIMNYLNSRYMRGKEVRRTHRLQVKKLPINNKKTSHPPFNTTLLNAIHRVQNAI